MLKADELAAGCALIERLRAEGYDVRLASDGCLYTCPDEFMDQAEAFLRAVAGLDDDDDEVNS